MWAHDHRFFFTAENVYKGNLMMVNYYSGPDRGNEALTDGVQPEAAERQAARLGQHRFRRQPDRLRRSHRPAGQLFFDIFDTDGFLGDLPLVNQCYAPFFEVCRGRIASASSMAACRGSSSLRSAGTSSAVPFKFIANDGNLVVNPIQLTQLDEQGIASATTSSSTSRSSGLATSCIS
jgi:hypothetical protein